LTLTPEVTLWDRLESKLANLSIPGLLLALTFCDKARLGLVFRISYDKRIIGEKVLA
jgi:hypothetical protein